MNSSAMNNSTFSRDRRPHRLWAFCLLFALGLSHAVAAALVGQPAPAFTLPDSAGGQRSLADVKGRVVVLEWTNHECPFVAKHYDAGNMQGLQRDYTGKGVAWFTVVSSAPGLQGHVEPEQARALTESRAAAPTAVLLDEDGTVGRAYGAKVTPHMYVIDRQGTLVYAGAIDSIRSASKADIPRARPHVREALEEVLAGRPVTTSTTQPYGCSIKYQY